MAEFRHFAVVKKIKYNFDFAPFSARVYFVKSKRLISKKILPIKYKDVRKKETD